MVIFFVNEFTLYISLQGGTLADERAPHYLCILLHVLKKDQQYCTDNITQW